MRSSATNNLGNRKVKESQFRSCGITGYGPTKNREGGDILCDHDARFLREQFFSYVSNNVGAKGEGRREPSSCS